MLIEMEFRSQHSPINNHIKIRSNCYMYWVKSIVVVSNKYAYFSHELFAIFNICCTAKINSNKIPLLSSYQMKTSNVGIYCRQN